MDGAALQLHTVTPENRVAPLLTALLPPLALYAALALTLGALFGAPFDAPALLIGAAVITAGLLPRKAARIAWAIAALGAALAFLLPAVRGGALLLANGLYTASEAVNAYAYDYFAAPDAASVRAALRVFAVLGGALCAAACRRRALLAALFFGVAFLEAYFGVVPGAWRNLLLFAVLAFLIARGDGGLRGGAALLAGLAAVALLVYLLAPRPIAAVEAYSERLRDELGALAETVAQPNTPPEEENDRARQESRQHEAQANADASAEQELQAFEQLTEGEREISLPHRVDYGRIALLLLATVAVLVVPFAPFLLLNRARRRAAERREAFETADNAAAIRAMFAHTMDWLRASGLQTRNRPFAQCAGAVETLTSTDYAARYAAAVLIWQEAAYSAHELDETKRAAIRALMEETERSLYGRADWRAKLRLKYIACLCE